MRIINGNWIFFFLLFISGTITGCAEKNNMVINNEVQDDIKYNATLLPSVSLLSWWKGFTDQQLNMLIDQALSQNMGIKQTKALLLSVYSINNLEENRYLPQLNAGVRPVQSASAENNYLHAIADMSWELSLYGQSEAAHKLDKANLLSAETRVHAAKVSVEAETVYNYLRYVYANEQLKFLEEKYKLQSENVKLEEFRNNAHISSNLDILTSERVKEDIAQASYDLLEIKEKSLQSLRLLTNNKKLKLNQSDGKLLFSDFRIKFIPNDLLRNRPDVREGEANVLKAAAEAGFARAALYPRFFLSGSITYSYDVNGSSRNTTGKPLGLGPVIDIPLWDWGKRKSESLAKEHQFHAALIAYRETVLSSLSEVQNTLHSLSYQEQRMQLVNSRLYKAEHSLKITEHAEKLGVVSRYDLNKMKMNYLSDKQLQLETGLQRCLKIIDLYKSLGGASLSGARSEI